MSANLKNLTCSYMIDLILKYREILNILNTQNVLIYRLTVRCVHKHKKCLYFSAQKTSILKIKEKLIKGLTHNVLS